VILLALGFATACATLIPVPKEIGFGDTFVGETSGTAEVYWEAGDDLLLVDGVAVTSPSSPFRITDPIPFPPPNRRFPFLKRTVTVSLVFNPPTAGVFHDEAAPQSMVRPLKAKPVFLQGRGVMRVTAGGGYVQPGPDPSIDFGDVVVGKTAYRTVTLTNPNDDGRSLSIEFGKIGTPFSAAKTATETSVLTELELSANESRTIIVEFTPNVPGDAADYLRVKDRLMIEPHLIVHLTGRGLSAGG